VVPVTGYANIVPKEVFYVNNTGTVNERVCKQPNIQQYHGSNERNEIIILDLE